LKAWGECATIEGVTEPSTPRLIAIEGFTRNMKRFWAEAETPDDLALARFLEKRISAFEAMTDEEFEREYDLV
jgi:hypothetical protein